MPPRPKSDTGWLAAFRARYDPWWAEAAPLVAAHDYAQAFKGYPWPAFAEAPWAPVRKPLAESRVAVVTTAGLYRPGLDQPFLGEAPEGDFGFRAIPGEVPLRSLAIAHAHFPHDVALADPNTIFPLDRLRELRDAGVIGDLAATHYSIMGYCTRAADLAEETAPAVAAGLRAEGVDATLVVPV
jgi:glycine/betaine/sarcosine/D-proline reductase family selenoprotein B